ncbi:EpsG family protein [Psychrobium sp. MM17-31]|uniref:EpsG family protein n=1 Tax=Psychrobium sp. MM17-31 TaxID=2917758 RepID=UPI001EF61AE9|nr:EpsG family protein [Psychrobium sp. MM17-31]MCG7531144.1 EpsG family protein [Psychrobium sp. MM17-31]
MLSFSSIIFTLFTILELIILHCVRFSENKKIVDLFLAFGVCLFITHFLLYFNVLHYSYSDDFLEYIKWFEGVARLDSYTDIDLWGKDPGFSYLLFVFTRVFDSPGTFVLLISIYVVVFIWSLAKFSSKGAPAQSLLLFFFFMLSMILLNRLALSHYSNVIRSFICSSLLIYCYLKVLDRKYIWCFFIPLVLLVHKFQFILFFICLLTVYLVPLRIILFGFLLSLLSFPTGFFAKFIVEQVTQNIEVLKNIYNSRILADEMKFTWGRKFQVILLIILPIGYLLIATIEKWAFKKNVAHQDKKLIKLALVTTVYYLLLVEVFPSSDRFPVILLPITYIMLIKYCSRNVIYAFSLLSIFLAFIAMQRNLEHLII